MESNVTLLGTEYECVCMHEMNALETLHKHGITMLVIHVCFILKNTVWDFKTIMHISQQHKTKTNSTLRHMGVLKLPCCILLSI